MLGVTSVEEVDVDPSIVNAGKQPVGEAMGASYFNSADSFAMIRGNHIDVAILVLYRLIRKVMLQIGQSLEKTLLV